MSKIERVAVGGRGAEMVREMEREKKESMRVRVREMERFEREEIGECGRRREIGGERNIRERNRGEREREAERATRGHRWRGGEKQEKIRCLEII